MDVRSTRKIVTWLNDEKKADAKSALASKKVDQTTFSAWDKAIADAALPAVIVDRGAFHRNKEKMARTVDGTNKTIRVATKALRVPELIAEVLASGHPFKGLMCYNAEEAAFLHSLNIGTNDFLVAYPTTRINNIRALRQMQNEGAKVTLVVDSVEQMKKISAALLQIDGEADAKQEKKSDAHRSREPLRILIDVDMSYLGFGAKRSPIKTDSDLRKILRASKDFPALKVVGAMGYEAVIAGLPDNTPTTSLWGRFMNKIKYLLRKLAAPAIAKKRARIPGIF